MANAGQFATATGGQGALVAAMQRRGIDASMLDQTSASSPMGPSQVAPSVPQTNPQVGSIPGQPVEQPKQQARSAEMEIALKALAGTVKTENDIAKNAISLSQRPF